MSKKDFYENVSIYDINKGIKAFIENGPIRAGTVTIGNFNLYKLLYAYFGSVSIRKEMNKLAEQYKK